MKLFIKCAIRFLTMSFIVIFNFEGVFSTFETREWNLIRKKHQRDVDRVYRNYVSHSPMWTVLNETNRKQFHRITESESWKNCCTIKVNKQIKHTHINNLKWWEVSATEYLTSIKRKFLIIFNIDVVDMKQRRRIFWFEVVKVMIMTKIVIDYVIWSLKLGFFDQCNSRSSCYLIFLCFLNVICFFRSIW